MAELINIPSITRLPYEIISIILGETTVSCRDVINFGLSCQLYYDYIRKDESLWKRKLERNLQSDVFDALNRNCNGEWLKEAENYYSLKKAIILEIRHMSPKFYSYNDEIAMQELRQFFEMALANDVSYYLSVSILCEMIKTGNKHLENKATNMVYTLTEIHYAKVVIHFLIHLFLAIKWGHICKNNSATTERVLPFFLQWIDTINIYSDEAIEEKIAEMVDMTESLLASSHPLKKASDVDRKKWVTSGLIENVWSPENCKNVLLAVNSVLYQHHHMTITDANNFDTLNIAKSINTKCGNVTTVGAIYSAVARRCGVRVDLITFPDHVFMEWKENDMADVRMSHIVNLTNGELQKKRKCPFSENRIMKYDPHALMHHLIKRCHESMGSENSWSSQNVFNLWIFLEPEFQTDNPYKNFLPYLRSKMASENSKYWLPPDMKTLTLEYRELMWALFDISTYRIPSQRYVVPKRRESHIKYAVGMVGYHLEYQYTCVIRGWDVTCMANRDWKTRNGIHTLKYGANQPFYTVLASDYSERYVAQENMGEKSEPVRLYNLEYQLSKDFSHFDGYSYVPNREKAAEYPDDENIRLFYQSRHGGTKCT